MGPKESDTTERLTLGARSHLFSLSRNIKVPTDNSSEESALLLCCVQSVLSSQKHRSKIYSTEITSNANTIVTLNLQIRKLK